MQILPSYTVYSRNVSGFSRKLDRLEILPLYLFSANVGKIYAKTVCKYPKNGKKRIYLGISSVNAKR